MLIRIFQLDYIYLCLIVADEFWNTAIKCVRTKVVKMLDKTKVKILSQWQTKKNSINFQATNLKALSAYQLYIQLYPPTVVNYL